MFSVLLVAVNCSASVKKCSTSEHHAHSHSDTVINTGVFRRWPAVGSKLPHCWTEKTEIRTLAVICCDPHGNVVCCTSPRTDFAEACFELVFLSGDAGLLVCDVIGLGVRDVSK